MPSDPRVAQVLAALAAPIDRYRSAVAATREEIRGVLAAGRAGVDARAADLRDQLGSFAAGRIDVSRLATLLGTRQSLDAASAGRLERAADVLRALLAGGNDLFHVTVTAPADLTASVAAQLAIVGRAFAAARSAAAAKAGQPSSLDDDLALSSFPYGEWTAAERAVAPPLVVSVSGADLHPAALARFLDGTQKLVLLVDGAAAPAPLVRLITPSVMVVQGHDVAALAPLAAWTGAGIAAILPDTAVQFLHDPAAGPEVWQRMSVQAPRDSRAVRLAGLTAAQQLDELRQLQILAARPAVSTPAPPVDVPAPAADPADRLAAWLLQQAGLSAGTLD